MTDVNRDGWGRYSIGGLKGWLALARRRFDTVSMMEKWMRYSAMMCTVIFGDMCVKLSSEFGSLHPVTKFDQWRAS